MSSSRITIEMLYYKQIFLLYFRNNNCKHFQKFDFIILDFPSVKPFSNNKLIKQKKDSHLKKVKSNYFNILTPVLFIIALTIVEEQE